MSMHLEGPWLSTTGKKKGKVKFKSAEQAKHARELAESWQQLQSKYQLKVIKNKVNKPTYELRVPPGRETRHIPSVDSGHTGAVSSKQPIMYTGNEMIGVTILHKSCLQPVFNRQEAVDAAKMRR